MWVSGSVDLVLCEWKLATVNNDIWTPTNTKLSPWDILIMIDNTGNCIHVWKLNLEAWTN